MRSGCRHDATFCPLECVSLNWSFHQRVSEKQGCLLAGIRHFRYMKSRVIGQSDIFLTARVRIYPGIQISGTRISRVETTGTHFYLCRSYFSTFIGWNGFYITVILTLPRKIIHSTYQAIVNVLAIGTTTTAITCGVIYKTSSIVKIMSQCDHK